MIGAAEQRGVEGGSIESWAEGAPATRQSLGEKTKERERVCVCVCVLPAMYRGGGEAKQGGGRVGVWARPSSWSSRRPRCNARQQKRSRPSKPNLHLHFFTS